MTTKICPSRQPLQLALFFQVRSADLTPDFLHPLIFAPGVTSLPVSVIVNGDPVSWTWSRIAEDRFAVALATQQFH